MLIANFTNYGEEITVDGLWQYDYGQRLQINGLNLPDVFEVHFFWKGLDKAKVVTGYSNDGVSVVDIPNEGLTQKHAITAYIYLSSPEEGETTNTIMMFVNKRVAPEGFETPDDVDLFHYTLLAAAEYLKQTKEAKKVSVDKSVESESWAHGHPDYPERDEDNAAYYAGVASDNAGSAYDSLVETQHLASQVHSDADATAQNTYLAAQYKAQATQSAANALLSEQAAKASETAAQEARAGAETAEEHAQLYAERAAADKISVELIKSETDKTAQKITEDKNTVQRLADDFTLTHQQAVADVNNAGQAQTERVENAGEAAVDEIEVTRQQAVNSVSDEGESQKNAVKSEGATQIENVQAAAEEIIVDREQIAENKNDIAELKGDLSELSEEVGQLKQNGTGTGTGLSAEIKSALMAVVENIGLWKDGNGQTYIDNLRTALYNEPLSSISAVYTQSKTVYVSDNLDVLKDDLVVTGTYTDGSSAIVTDYTLSGTLTVGTSMITVSKNGKTATFEVTVTASRVPATGITLNNTTLSFTGSTPIQLTATVEPSNSTDTVVWSSSEDAVATVDENGLVTPIANGTCTITATCGNHSVDCSVSITLPLSGYNFGNPCLNYVNSDPTTLGKTDEELKGKFYNGAYNSWGNAIGITNQYWLLYPLGEGTHYIRTVSNSTLPPISFYAFSNSDIVANPTTTLGKVGTDYTEATVTVFKSFDCEYTNSQGIVNLGEYSYVDESGQTYSDSLVQLRKVVVPKDVYVFMAIATIVAKYWPGISEAHPYMNDLYTIFEEDPSSNILQIVE